MHLPRLIAVDLALKRFKRSKSTSITVFSAILITITFILGTAAGTKYLQSSIVIRDLDYVLTDINIGTSFLGDLYHPNLNNLSVDLNELPYVNQTIIKYQVRGEEWGAENLIHHIWVNKSNNCTFDFASHRRQLNILGYDSENFKEYIKLMDIRLERKNEILLKTNETIISHYFAQKLNISINDTIYLHYVNWNGTWRGDLFSSKSYPLTVKNIITIPSKSNIAKDLLKNPFNSNNEGTIDELMVLESETFLKVLENLAGNYGEEFSRQLVLSIFLKREPIIASYNLKKSPLLLGSIEKEILSALRGVLPKGTVFYSENILLRALNVCESDIKELQRTLIVISIPIFCLVFVITLYLRIITINNQISFYGVFICRGLHKKDIRRSFLIEGGIVGVIASISSSLTCSGLISLLYFVIPNNKNYFDWINVFIIDLPSYMVNALFLGLVMGIGVNLFATRKIMEINPLDSVQIYRGRLTSWYGKHRKKVRIIIIPLTLIVTLGIILEIVSLTGFLGMFEKILHEIENVMFGLFLLLPILLILLLIVIVTNRRDFFANYMVTFSFFLNKNVKDIMRSNYLRRPKNFSKLALITVIAFAMSITPIMLSQSAQDVSIRQIKRDIGSDIRITGTYEQLKPISPSTLYNFSSEISGVTPMTYIAANIIVVNRTDLISISQTGILAVQPENFVETTFFEDYFTPENEPGELFSQLRSDIATAVAPSAFKNWETYYGDYVNHDIGSVLPVRYDFTNGETAYLYFTVVGFFYLIPGFTQRNFNPPRPLICSIDYLESSITIPPDSQMMWFIKINPEANKTIRAGIYQSINDQFKDFKVVFVDSVIESFLFTPIGSIVIIMDSMFFIVFVVALFGLSLTFFQTFNERRTEVAIYRSRGMSSGDIRKMFLFEMLSVDSLGAISGIILGFITALTYKDVLITPWPKIPVYLFFPWIKIIFFILVLTITHIISIFGQNYWSTRSRIIDNLQIRD